MAKLNGVKTVDMQDGKITKISYEGVEYTAVDVTERKYLHVGDIIQNGYKHRDLTMEAFYIAVLDDDYVTLLDDVGDGHSNATYNMRAVFRKVNAQPSSLEAKVDSLDKRVTALEASKQTPKTEKRHAKVGERILITKASRSQTGCSYGNGEVMTVTRIGGIGLPICGIYESIAHSEYEVIVEDAKPAEPAPAQSLTHNGADYTLVSRKAQPGDVVILTETGGYVFESGKPYEVLDGVKIRDGSTFLLYKVGVNRTEENVLVYAPTKEALKVGDYVVCTDGSRYVITTTDMTLGEVVKDHDNGDIRLKVIAHKTMSGEVGELYSVEAKYFRKATDAEVEKIMPKLKVGDTVEVIDGSKAYYGDFKTGTVGKVANVRANGGSKEIKVETDDDFDRFPSTALRKVAAKAKPIPLIPQKGDVVRATNAGFNSGEPFKPGDIGIVKGADGTMVPFVEFNGCRKYADVVVIARAKDRVDVA